MKYIALLRGVNVGGNNKLLMSELKSAFVQHGFSNVTTYINSGNVLFSHDSTDEEVLKAECEALIRDAFQMDLSVVVLSAQRLVEALSHAPAWWNSDDESKHNAIFVIPPATADQIFAAVGEIKPEFEKVGYYGQIIFWSAPLKTFSRTRWSKVVGTTAYGSITIRNANTAIKLAELAKTDMA